MDTLLTALSALVGLYILIIVIGLGIAAVSAIWIWRKWNNF